MRKANWTLIRRIFLVLLFGGVILYSLFPMYWMVISGLRAGRALFEPLLLPGAVFVAGLQDHPQPDGLSDVLPQQHSYRRRHHGNHRGGGDADGLRPGAHSRLPGMMLMVRAMLFAYMFPRPAAGHPDIRIPGEDRPRRHAPEPHSDAQHLHAAARCVADVGILQELPVRGGGVGLHRRLFAPAGHLPHHHAPHPCPVC